MENIHTHTPIDVMGSSMKWQTAISFFFRMYLCFIFVEVYSWWLDSRSPIGSIRFFQRATKNIASGARIQVSAGNIQAFITAWNCSDSFQQPFKQAILTSTWKRMQTNHEKKLGNQRKHTTKPTIILTTNKADPKNYVWKIWRFQT